MRSLVLLQVQVECYECSNKIYWETLKNDAALDRLRISAITSGTTKVRNSGLGPDPDLSAKSGPE